MTKDNIRYLQTLDWKDAEKIMKIAEKLNAKKRSYQSKTNMQSIVRAMVSYCLSKGLKFKTDWGKYVTIKEEIPEPE